MAGAAETVGGLVQVIEEALRWFNPGTVGRIVDQDFEYRGVLLPFSSDDDTIDFILGVINWKQAAEPALAQAIAEAKEREAEARKERQRAAGGKIDFKSWNAK